MTVYVVFLTYCAEITHIRHRAEIHSNRQTDRQTDGRTNLYTLFPLRARFGCALVLRIK